MKRILFFVVCVIVLTQLPVLAESKVLGDKAQLRKISDEFMQRVMSNNIPAAFELVEPYFPLPENEFSMLQMQSVKQLGMVGQRFGSQISYEFIKEASVNDIFIKHVYLQKYEKHAVRWTFIFYNPKDGWIINNLRWDDNIDDLFNEGP